MGGKPLSSCLRVGLLLAALASLSGCGGGGSGSGTSSNSTAALPTVSGGSTPASLWNTYYVQAYDMAKVMAVRASQAFTNSTIRYSFPTPVSPNDSLPPAYANGKVTTSNALEDAHLDYAFSTGLTGKNITLGMIDDEIGTSSPQFSGKTITLDGSTGTPASDGHGTGVASVMVGNGSDGQMTGFSPASNLFAGTISYTSALDWAKVGQYMLDAKSKNVLAVNNSWGFDTASGATATVANTDLQSAFGSGGPATYLNDVRSYIKSGVVVVAAQNDYNATSISALAGLPSAFPDLKTSWLAVINAIPSMNGETITGADRISAPCAEAATYCIAANGQTKIVDYSQSSGYGIGAGASFAAPQVTGALGLLAQAFPTLTPQQLRDRLLVTANNSFYTATGTVTFAPGIVHGYNSEFGMGFLDLKAALLPIGKTSVPTASGSSLPANQALVASSPASGNAIASSLAGVKVVVMDQMGGSFQTPAASFAAAPVKVDPATLQLGVLGSPSDAREAGLYAAALETGSAEAMLNHADLMDTPDAATLYSGATQRSLVWRGLRLTVGRSDGQLTSLGVATDFPAGNGALRLGVTGFVENGGLLGVTAPGDAAAISSHAASVQLSYATPLARGLSLRAEGEFGLAKGTPGGVITSFGTVGYDRVGLALDEADLARPGDVLTLFARTPVAITSGAATLELPTSFALSGPQFSATPVSLSPSARELDLGFEYSRPLHAGAVLRGGFAYAMNAGNVAGAHSVSAVLGLTVAF